MPIVEQAQDLLSSEITNAYGANAVCDRQTQGPFGSSYQSPQQHAGYVQTVGTFLASKVSANVQSYRTAMGQNPTSLDIVISPTNQVKLATLGINVSSLVPGLFHHLTRKISSSARSTTAKQAKSASPMETAAIRSSNNVWAIYRRRLAADQPSGRNTGSFYDAAKRVSDQFR